ncbi:hypothetical protein F5146DRAFT_1039203 [Armillaria mellea]|nr:hypothetical protein F5146DRAFT_1039203 [Armillaria mellea]
MFRSMFSICNSLLVLPQVASYSSQWHLTHTIGSAGVKSSVTARVSKFKPTKNTDQAPYARHLPQFLGTILISRWLVSTDISDIP